MTSNQKDWVEYGTAIAMVASAIIIAVTAYLLQRYIHSSLLIYISEALVYAAGVFGVSIYFKSKLGDFGTEVQKHIEKALADDDKRIRSVIHEEIKSADKGKSSHH